MLPKTLYSKGMLYGAHMQRKIILAFYLRDAFVRKAKQIRTLRQKPQRELFMVRKWDCALQHSTHNRARSLRDVIDSLGSGFFVP